MQLGTRWSVGAKVPDRLPDSVVQAVHEVETELAGFDASQLDTSSWRWTLTWLEGNPVVELDDGTIVRLDPHSGHAVIAPPADD